MTENYKTVEYVTRNKTVDYKWLSQQGYLYMYLFVLLYRYHLF